MILLEVRLPRNAMFPHVIGDLVAAARCRDHGARVELADSPRREDRGLDAVTVEQLDQAPDPDASTEFALRELRRGLVGKPSQQHGIEIGGEVNRDLRATGPLDRPDRFITLDFRDGSRCERVDLGFKAVGHARALKWS